MVKQGYFVRCKFINVFFRLSVKSHITRHVPTPILTSSVSVEVAGIEQENWYWELELGLDKHRYRIISKYRSRTQSFLNPL